MVRKIFSSFIAGAMMLSLAACDVNINTAPDSNDHAGSAEQSTSAIADESTGSQASTTNNNANANAGSGTTASTSGNTGSNSTSSNSNNSQSTSTTTENADEVDTSKIETWEKKLLISYNPNDDQYMKAINSGNYTDQQKELLANIRAFDAHIKQNYPNDKFEYWSIAEGDSKDEVEYTIYDQGEKYYMGTEFIYEAKSKLGTTEFEDNINFKEYMNRGAERIKSKLNKAGINAIAVRFYPAPTCGITCNADSDEVLALGGKVSSCYIDVFVKDNPDSNVADEVNKLAGENNIYGDYRVYVGKAFTDGMDANKCMEVSGDTESEEEVPLENGIVKTEFSITH